MSTPYEELLKDYFSYAYGGDAEKVLAYFESVEACFDVAFTEGEKSIDRQRSAYFCPTEVTKLSRAEELAKEARALSNGAATAPTRLQAVSMRLLRYHAEYLTLLADFLIEKAEGRTEGARAAYERYRVEFGKREAEIERYYDHFLAIDALKQLAYEHNHGF
jgi:hypothetical protein